MLGASVGPLVEGCSELAKEALGCPLSERLADKEGTIVTVGISVLVGSLVVVLLGPTLGSKDEPLVVLIRFCVNSKAKQSCQSCGVVNISSA